VRDGAARVRADDGVGDGTEEGRETELRGLALGRGEALRDGHVLEEARPPERAAGLAAARMRREQHPAGFARIAGAAHDELDGLGGAARLGEPIALFVKLGEPGMFFHFFFLKLKIVFNKDYIEISPCVKALFPLPVWRGLRVMPASGANDRVSLSG